VALTVAGIATTANGTNITANAIIPAIIPSVTPFLKLYILRRPALAVIAPNTMPIITLRIRNNPSPAINAKSGSARIMSPRTNGQH
jgi:hypothetical protein